MTHHTGLENRRSGNVTEGSNPSLSADFRGFQAECMAAHRAPFTPRSYSSDGAQVGTPIRYALVPMTVKAAIQWVRNTHRHLPVIQGGLFAAAVECDGRTVAAGIAVNPARVWQGTGRIVIGRVAALPDLEPVGDHAAPACTMIYGSLCRAAKALGYREAWTYTLPGESGASLRAAGFTYMGETKSEEWDRPSRARSAAVSPSNKGRWLRRLGA